MKALTKECQYLIYKEIKKLKHLTKVTSYEIEESMFYSLPSLHSFSLVLILTSDHDDSLILFFFFFSNCGFWILNN